MTHTSSLNIAIMDVAKFIKQRMCGEVTSTFIHVPSEPTKFDSNGLFSESIFGDIGTPERFTRHGYITLNCRVFHPLIFQNIRALKRAYVDIMAGKAYAVWDPVNNEFVNASENDEGADTGFAFFLKHFDKVDFKKNQSLKRNDKINVLIKYKDHLFIKHCLVIPAGIRDMKEEDGRVEEDSINSLYSSLINSARAMIPSGDTDPIYDVVHYAIQRKVNEIYDYLLNLIDDKRGYLQGKLGHRAIAGSTRNVITATSLEATDPSSPQFHKCDETKVPLFQSAKAFASLMVYQIKSLFYSSIIEQSSDSIALIDPVTFKLVYTAIDPKDKDMLITEEGIQKTIDRFRDLGFRTRPVTVRSNKQPYYLYLVYDDGKTIYIFRNLDEFKGSYNGELDPAKLRPLTYAEMIYTAAFFATKDKHVLVTRYPITDEQSIFPSRIHVMTTSPARVVTLASNQAGAGILLPEWPIIGAKFVDAVMLHPTKLRGLGADFDGDTISVHPVYTDEANAECENSINSLGNFAFPSGEAISGVDDLCKLTMHALTVDPPKQ